MPDFTIASKIVPPTPINPLELIGKVQSVQGQQLQNRILGQNVAQTIAQRKAAQGAIDTTTGTFDPNRYMANLAGDENGSGVAPEAAIQAQQQRQAQLQAQIASQNLTQEQLKTSAVENANAVQIGQSIQGSKDYSKAGISNMLDTAAPTLFKSSHALQQLEAFKGLLTDDPAANAALVQKFVLQHGEVVKALGAISDVDAGGTKLQRRINPGTAEQEITSGITMGRGPESKASLVDVYDPVTKTTKKVPSGEIIGDSAPAAMHPQTGPALGEAEAAGGNVQQALALQNRASIVPQRRAALANIVNTLDKFNTGPKAAAIGTLKGLASQFGISTKGIDESKAAQDEFNKLASQIALDQWGALGGTGSNHQLETTMHANPNEVMSKMGIKNVAALLQGNEDAIGAQYDAWQKFKAVHGPASYDQFQLGWNKYYDPRVFQAEHMAPKDRATMLASMTPEERKTFTRDQNIAQQAGWLGK